MTTRISHTAHYGGHAVREDQANTAPRSSFLLGTAAMLPIVVGALISFAAPEESSWLVPAVILWSGAVLCFLGGVRRGLSFRQPGGSTVGQLVTSLWLLACGLIALAAPWQAIALAVLVGGYVSVAILDSMAARRAEVPRYFEHFRPWQMVLPILGLLLLFSRLVPHAGVHHE